MTESDKTDPVDETTGADAIDPMAVSDLGADHPEERAPAAAGIPQGAIGGMSADGNPAGECCTPPLSRREIGIAEDEGDDPSIDGR